jgi:hypothetical protein
MTDRTIGFVVYRYSESTTQGSCDACRWLVVDEFQTMQEAIWRVYQFNKANPFARLKIARERIFF